METLWDNYQMKATILYKSLPFETQHPADNLCIIDVPVVITNHSPFSIVLKLHPPGILIISLHQANSQRWNGTSR